MPKTKISNVKTKISNVKRWFLKGGFSKIYLKYINSKADTVVALLKDKQPRQQRQQLFFLLLALCKRQYCPA
jgi:hypothetical protein